MENIYDIRKEKQLQFVLSTEMSLFTPTIELLQSCAVVVNLFYTEKVEVYSTYLNRLPENIAVYIFSSKPETLDEAEKYCCHKNTFFLGKNNRGRDISAFLVAFRSYINKYKLICFVHDKKEHYPWLKQDIEKWNENLWGNMIATKDYIYNILQIFDNHDEVGMLFPPEPLGEHKVAWYKPSWNDNFTNCLKLADKMKLSADINIKKPPITIGSVFWARKEVLAKLVNMNWQYEDFPEEPMQEDFTVSHAIERIFGYVAQDAGYDVATVMTEQYASWTMLFLQDYVRELFLEVSDRMGLDNFHQFRILKKQVGKIADYIKNHKVSYFYGAGKYGIALLNLLREKGREPTGFVVTDRNKSEDMVAGLKVFELKDINPKEAGVVLTVYYPLQKEMKKELRKHNIYDFMVLFED